MIISNAKYTKGISGEVTGVSATINGESMSIPLDLSNRHYAEILKWVEEGNTIEEAD